MKILLIDPPGKNKGLNTGLGYLSAMLKDRHDIAVLDLNNTEIGLCGEPNPNMPIEELNHRILSKLDRQWGYIEEYGKYLRVILLEDGITVHNAFFDRRFKEDKDED